MHASVNDRFHIENPTHLMHNKDIKQTQGIFMQIQILHGWVKNRLCSRSRVFEIPEQSNKPLIKVEHKNREETRRQPQHWWPQTSSPGAAEGRGTDQ